MIAGKNDTKQNSTDNKSDAINNVINSSSLKAYRFNGSSKYVSGKKLSDTAALNTQQHTASQKSRLITSYTPSSSANTKNKHEKKTFSYSGIKAEKREIDRKNSLVSADVKNERKNAMKFRFMQSIQNEKIVKSNLAAHTYKLAYENDRKRFSEAAAEIIASNKKKSYTNVHFYKESEKKRQENRNREDFEYNTAVSSMDKLKILEYLGTVNRIAKETKRAYEESDTASETIGNLAKEPFRAGKRIFERNFKDKIKDEVTNRIRSSYYRNRTSTMVQKTTQDSARKIEEIERKKFYTKKAYKTAQETAKKEAAKKAAQQAVAKEAAKREFAKAATKAAADSAAKAAAVSAGGSMLVVMGAAALVILIVLVILLFVIIIMCFFWATPHKKDNVFENGSFQTIEYKEEEKLLKGYIKQVQQYFDEEQLKILKIVDMDFGGFEPDRYHYPNGNARWDPPHASDNYLWDLYHYQNKWIKLSNDFDMEHIVALVAIYKFKEINAEDFNPDTYKFEITDEDLDKVLGQMRFYDVSYTFYYAPCPKRKCARVMTKNGWVYYCNRSHKHLAGSVTNWEPSWGYDTYAQSYFWDKFFTAEEQEEYKPLYDAYYEYISDRLGVKDKDGKIIKKSHTPLDNYESNAAAKSRLKHMYMAGG